jgi:hypothetical protein
MHCYLVVLRRPPEKLEVAMKILLIQKAGTPVVAPLDEVVWIGCYEQSWMPRHMQSFAMAGLRR